MPHEHYEELARRIREVHAALSTQYLLEWDQQTCMPRRGAGHRALQIGVVAAVAHERLTHPRIGDLLEVLGATDADDPVTATNLREIRRDYERAVRLPTPLVQEIASATARATETWQAARRDSAFALFAPELEHLLELKRQAADALGWQEERYDALMDEYEPGARTREVARLFDALKARLIPLVAAVGAAPRQPDLRLLKRSAAVADQIAFNRQVAAALGYDFDAGRIDVSAHPFCSGFCPGDVRMTTRYDEHGLPGSLFGIMHETGHALYEQGLLEQHTGTPMGQPVSLGIHESQSRLWENQVGRSAPFWRYLFPRLQAAFGAWSDVQREDWLFAVNAVRPSFIRVEADEVTYGLHIMLRFELERRLLDGTLAVREVPEAWNAAFRELLGITPPDDAQGCLQDIHWSQGMFGYFPTYQLGNLYAAQFFAAARAALGDLDGQLARGEFRPLLDWLRAKIHTQGKRYRARELVRVVTGREPSHDAYLAYLRDKVGTHYGVQLT